MPDFQPQRARVGAGSNASAAAIAPGVPGRTTLVEQQPASRTFDPECMAALQALAATLQRGARGYDWGLGGPTRFFPALATISEAVRGERDDGKALAPDERQRYFEAGLAALAPALELAAADPGRRAWLDVQVTPYVARVRAELATGRAEQRVRDAISIGGEVIELPPHATPREQAPVVQLAARELVRTLASINETAIRFGHDPIHHEVEHLMAGHGHATLGILELQHALVAIDTLLALDDEHLAHELAHPEGVFAGVASFAELVELAIELLGEGIALTGYFVAAIGKALGDTGFVASGMGLARMTGLVFANIVAAVELVHGVAVLLDRHATGEAKEAAVVDVLSSGAWLASRAVGGAASAPLAAASAAIVVEYAELHLLAAEYEATRQALVAVGLRGALAELIELAGRVAAAADTLARAGTLAQRETDPARRDALARAEKQFARELGAAIDALLERCRATPVAGAGRFDERGDLRLEPGASQAIRAAFEPLQARAGTSTTPAAAAENARAVIDQVVWCTGHARELARAELGEKEDDTVAHGSE
ncbi:MAG TPA: hypothetical protein VLX92_26515 [Kofleriaceae bacterium]|nr:hypothetical protein [Kofleriaceae bacterium]